MDKKEDKPSDESAAKDSTNDGNDKGEEPSQQNDQKSNSSEGADGGADESFLASILRSLHLGPAPKEKHEQVLKTVDFEGITEHIKSKENCRVVTMAGAGISTSAGIPDFRSPGSGLYDNLQKYNLPDPQAIFNIDFFRENPEPFFELARELFPGQFKPTPCHYFIKMLSDKGLLLRHYTQNIDTLERVSGLPDDKIVEAHGTFHSSHCLNCNKQYQVDWMKEKLFEGGVPKCEAEGCDGVVKPDIVFFGEALPRRFFECVKKDMSQCDVLIIMGTSLVVQPFASLLNSVPKTTPRLYINREKNPPMDPFMALLMGGGASFDSDSKDNYRDVFWAGDCDDGAIALADKLGWAEELKSMIKTEHSKIDEDTKKPPQAKC